MILVEILASYWIVSNANLNSWAWMEEATHLPKADSPGPIAVYNNTIYLFGGENYPSQLTEFDILSQQFLYRGDYSLNSNVSGMIAGQFWTQINEIVYWFQYDSYQYDIISYDLINNAQQTFYTEGTDESFEGSCLTSTDSYLFLLGGSGTFNGNTLQIYSFSSQKWSEGPSMQTARHSFSCVVHPTYNTLYAIAGYPDLKSVEKIEINNIRGNYWQWLEDLPISLQYHRSVIVADWIVIFGGVSISDLYEATKDVFIIDASTESITSGAPLQYAVAYGVPITVRNVIYLFGGKGVNGGKGIYFLDRWQYCIVPTYAPTNSPTIEPTIQSQSTMVTNQQPTVSPTSSAITREIWLLIGVVLLLTCILLLFCCFRRKQSMRKTVLIRNPMVILVGIGEYDQEPAEPDLNVYLNDLDVDIDIRNLLKLFDDGLNYNIYPKYDQYPNIFWKQNELICFLQKQAEIFSKNVMSNKENEDGNKKDFDALIVVISCHGWNKKLITSDHKLIDRDVIHRLFSSYYPSSREVPRVIIYDCCDGDEDRKGVNGVNRQKKSNAADVGKAYLVENIPSPPVPAHDRAASRGSVLWPRYTQNPDYKLALIHATNLGFQSKMNSEVGSYFVSKFVSKTLSVLEKGTKKQPFLYEILDEIQKELGETKQLPTFTYNNDTRFIKFVANTKHVKADDVLEEYEYEEKEEVEDADDDNKSYSVDDFEIITKKEDDDMDIVYEIDKTTEIGQSVEIANIHKNNDEGEISNFRCGDAFSI